MGNVVGQVTIGPLCVSFQAQASIAHCYHGGDGTGVPHCIVPVATASQLQLQGVVVYCRAATWGLYLKARLFNKTNAHGILQQGPRRPRTAVLDNIPGWCHTLATGATGGNGDEAWD
jgi:hypothetical protein